MAKKILVVDDSALMRRVFCDIIATDGRYQVEDEAKDGKVALELLQKKSYDVVVLDVNMPRMDGIELLKVLQKEPVFPRVMMASLYTKEGAKVTMEALDLGALDFVHIPSDTSVIRTPQFMQMFLGILEAVANGTPRHLRIMYSFKEPVKTYVNLGDEKKRIVAIASSTGGPQALKSLLKLLPENLNAPLVLVQHMPSGFTKTLAERLNTECSIHVKEAEQGEIITEGWAYLAPGGKHMRIKARGDGRSVIVLSDEAPRENVRPCANYLFESIQDQGYEEAVCVVLTGMGSDGTEGIMNLQKKQKVRTLVQSPDTCVVFGMPGSIIRAQLECEVLDLEAIATEIIKNVGVK